MLGRLRAAGRQDLVEEKKCGGGVQHFGVRFGRPPFQALLPERSSVASFQKHDDSGFGRWESGAIEVLAAGLYFWVLPARADFLLR